MINYKCLEKVGEYKDGSLIWFTDREENVVYLINIGEEYYIGSTKNLHRRFCQYISALSNNKYCSPIMQKKFNEIGCFSIYILERVNNDNLFQREQLFIDLYRPTLNNITAHSWKRVNTFDFETELFERHHIRLRSFCRKYNIKPHEIKDGFRIFFKMANILDVPIWQLFVSPQELQRENHSLVCPKCGTPLELKIKE